MKMTPEDVVHCIGLLIARMLCPHKRRFAEHWATKPVGAVPKGTFGSYKGKSRFECIMQNLHFTVNTDARAETDRVWKVRSVVDTLQHTFARGYNVPPVLSFDEAMIPSRSRHNETRQLMKDKPHNWGTKLFMTCCATTAYCLRLEVSVALISMPTSLEETRISRSLPIQTPALLQLSGIWKQCFLVKKKVSTTQWLQIDFTRRSS